MKRCLQCGGEVTSRGRKFCSKKCCGEYRSRTACRISRESLVKEYVEDGVEVLEIARRHGISPQTVFNYLKRYGIEKRNNYIDFTGKRVGQLRVVEPMEVGHKGGGKHIRWRCVCDCGNEYIAYSHHLSRCLTTRCSECAAKSRRSELELKHYMWNSLERSAKLRKLQFTIDREQAYQLFVEQDRRCALSGVPIGFAECAGDHKAGKTTASLDRIDSSKGYVLGNVHWVHKAVNFMKGELIQSEFVQWCSLIVEHNTAGSGAKIGTPHDTD